MSPDFWKSFGLGFVCVGLLAVVLHRLGWE